MGGALLFFFFVTEDAPASAYGRIEITAANQRPEFTQDNIRIECSAANNQPEF